MDSFSLTKMKELFGEIHKVLPLFRENLYFHCVTSSLSLKVLQNRVNLESLYCYSSMMRLKSNIYSYSLVFYLYLTHKLDKAIWNLESLEQ